MSRFNESKTDSTKVINQAGGQAFQMKARAELASIVGSSFLSEIHYEGSDIRLKRLKDLVREIINEDGGAMFIAKVASYTRNKLHMRTMPTILLIELAKIHNGDDIVRRATNKVVQRADEISEALAYWKHSLNIESLGKKAITKQLRLGLADRFHAFDEYQFAKYKGTGKQISLRDAMFLVHPKPRGEDEAELFKRIATDTMATPDTWETKLSATKGDETAKKEAWESMIDSKKMGYMATLRNLRNIIESKLSNKYLKQVADYISNETAVLNSKQLPMRFLSAYRALKEQGTDTNHVFMKAIEKAMLISAKNISWFNDTDNVLIACDVSGSMESSNTSIKSGLTFMDIGLSLSLTLKERLDFATFGIFGENWAEIKDLTPGAIINNVEYITRTGGNRVGHSTQGYKALKWANQSNRKFDKVIMFTDCQLYGGNMVTAWKEYKKNVNPNAEFILVDIAGYGNTPLKINDLNVYSVTGWSDKVFDAIEMMRDTHKMLSYIENEEI